MTKKDVYSGEIVYIRSISDTVVVNIYGDVIGGDLILPNQIFPEKCFEGMPISIQIDGNQLSIFKRETEPLTKEEKDFLESIKLTDDIE